VNLPVGGTIVYTVTANVSASATGNLVNTAEVTTPPGLTDPNPGNNTSTVTTPPSGTVDLSATKDNGQTVFAGKQTVTYTITIRNNGGETATGAVVTDPKPVNIAKWKWTCTTQSGGATGCNGAADSSNDFTDTVNLPVGATIVYKVTATVVDTPTGTTLENTVTVDPPAGITDSDPSNNSAKDVDELGPSADLQLIKTPETKQVEIGDTLTFTLTLTNLGPDDAFDVEVTDKLPGAFTYISSKPSKGAYDATTGVWTVGDMPVNAVATLEITVKVNGAGTNVAKVTQSLDGPDGLPLIDPKPENNLDESKITIKDPDDDKKKSNPFLIPVTGFQPGVVTDLSRVPHEAYLATADVTLEIPSLGVKIPIVGVPKKDGTWNVAWLENQAGWLEGSAFPSWNGNSVLTSHVYLASGKPGPFVNLNKLKYGDTIIVHAYGQKYTFAVQTNTVVAPTDKSTMMKHEEKPWLTLVTCKDYDPRTNTYLSRILVRAALVNVEWE
jgi:LPXTG-site transpeptidase (sortase) family protein